MALRLFVRWVAITGAVLLTGGCNIVPVVMDATTQARVLAVPPGRAAIYLVCPLAPPKRSVFLNGEAVGQTRRKTYLAWHVRPGPIEIGVGEPKAKGGVEEQEITLVAGRAYYFLLRAQAAGLTGRFFLEQIDAETGRRGVIRCVPGQARSAGPGIQAGTGH